MKYIPAYERFFNEEDKNKTLVHHYKDGKITTKGEPTDADDVDNQIGLIQTIVSLFPKLVPGAENIELAYIPISSEVITKFNVGEEERCFVMKNVFNGFLLYSSVEIPMIDVLTRVREWHPEIEVYEDYPYAYFIPAELASWTKFILNHPELKDIVNHPCTMIS
jgi:hypothetical protein|nr:MAG TPA: hypothetical protein [Caudoviricetes sp.]